ncbi:MAG: chemotaxis protein CheR [Proteobacteria bacterium]|nr:MAG: chemotaxis protein CheR [Pseudomonadota bacterium]
MSGVDFQPYKRATVLRRLRRRMALHRIDRLDAYASLLRTSSDEAQLLHRDLLIRVTRFFRDPDSFETLRTVVFPEITRERGADSPIRIWVSGCASGEEAYSVAISLLDFLGDRASAVPIQIFATDVSDAAIDHARNGLYPAAIENDVPADLLRRFFTRSDGSYRVAKAVRDVCVFARQDLTRDPPFSHLDLVLCRNVLIYMTPPLQRRLLGLFHYALNPTGFLVLGHAETVGPHADLFRIAHKRNRVYVKKSIAAPPPPRFAIEAPAAPAAPARLPRSRAAQRPDSIQGDADRILLARYAPAGVIVDADFQIVHFRGQTGPYLEPPPGEPSLAVLKMARDGLFAGLRSALQAARKTLQPVRREGIRVKTDGSWREVTVDVTPLSSREPPHFLVTFEEAGSAAPASGASAAQPRPAEGAADAPLDERRVAKLQEEIAASRDYLQSIIQELEAANEELQSANEEILSSNEELQSTNEELDTAKEELQSTNEELSTVNEELQARNAELSRVNSDLVNLLASVEIAIVIVASDLRIRRFTPMAERVLNLIPSDIGRSIAHIKPNIDCPDLERLIGDVIERVTPQEREVQDHQGAWYSLRIRPYKSLDNRIEGAVLSLFDVDAAKRHEQYAQTVVETVREPIALLDRELRVRIVNDAFCEAFGMRREDLEGHLLFDMEEPLFAAPALRDALAERALRGERVEDLEIALPPRGGAPRTLLVNARRIDATPTRLAPAVLLAVEDVSARGSRR